LVLARRLMNYIWSFIARTVRISWTFYVAHGVRKTLQLLLSDLAATCRATRGFMKQFSTTVAISSVWNLLYQQLLQMMMIFMFGVAYTTGRLSRYAISACRVYGILQAFTIPR